MNMKRLLIVIDYQNDFVCGSLGFDNAKKLEKGILEKIAEYQNDEIIYTLDTHFDDYLTTAEGKSLPVPRRSQALRRISRRFKRQAMF